MDIPLVVAGQTVHFTQARLTPYRDTVGLSLISSKIDVAGDWLDGLQVASITGPNGQRNGPDQASGTTVLPWATPDHEPLALLDFVVADPATGVIQTGHYHVELGRARVAVRGPWVLSWNLP